MSFFKKNGKKANFDWLDDDKIHKKHFFTFSKTSIITLLLFIALFITLFFMISSSSNTHLEFKSQFKDYQEIPANKKLDKPLLGTNNDVENQSQNDQLPHSDEFDFSPIDNNNIEYTAILPKKFANHTKINEFERLLQKPVDNDTHSHVKQFSIAEYNNLSLDDLQNISRSYLPLWKQNSVLSNVKNLKHTGPIFSLVIDYDPNILPIELLPKAPVTIALDSTEDIPQELIDKLRQNGYEVILNIPMQRDDDVMGLENGIYPISKNMSFEAMRKAVNWHATHLKGIIGFKNRNSAAVMTSQSDMNYLMNLIADYDLTFLEAVSSNDDNSRIIAYAAASAAGIPAHKADQILNDLPTDLPIFLRKIAKLQYGIAIMRADAKNLKLLDNILQKLDDKNISLVPLSVIYSKSSLPEKF